MKPVISPVIQPVRAPVTNRTSEGVSSAPQANGLLDNLAEWFEMNEASGNRTGSHAAIVLTQSGGVGSAAGIGGVGTAALFDGVDDKLQVADNATLSLGADTPTTLAFWARFDYGANAWIVTKTDGVNAAGNEYLITASASGGLAGGIGNGVTGDQGDFAGASLADATWAFVVWQHDPDANVHRVSVNNGAFITRTWSGGTQNGSNPLAIGMYAGFATQQYKGRLAKLGIWKRILDADQLTALYNGGAGLSYADLS